MKKTDIGRQVALTAVCLLLGFVVSLQLKSVTINYASSNTEVKRAEELQKDLLKEKTKNEELYSQLMQMKNEVEQYRKISEENGNVSQVLMEQVNMAETLAGLSAVEGTGVVVTLKDATGEQTALQDAQNSIIHEGDLRTIINELLASGAEVVSLNDERLVSTSSIRCVGPTVMVNNTRIAPPFVIKAIGDSKTLEAGLLIKDGIVEVLKSYGISVDIQISDKVAIPAYKGAVTFKYAQKVKQTGNGGN